MHRCRICHEIHLLLQQAGAPGAWLDIFEIYGGKRIFRSPKGPSVDAQMAPSHVHRRCSAAVPVRGAAQHPLQGRAHQRPLCRGCKDILKPPPVLLFNG